MILKKGKKTKPSYVRRFKVIQKKKPQGGVEKNQFSQFNLGNAEKF